MSVHYYKGFYSNYNHPFKGVDEVSLKDIEKLTSYYVEEKDDIGNIISFKKILDGDCFFEFHYQYDHDKLVEVIKVVDCKK